MQFWRKAERVVQYKQQVVSNARKKEVMDKHLDFLVGQTQRYSSLLAQRLAGKAPEHGSSCVDLLTTWHLEDL
jgi:hypothetical protein